MQNKQLILGKQTIKQIIFVDCLHILVITGLPHTQGIQGNSRNFQVEENIGETQGDSGNF